MLRRLAVHVSSYSLGNLFVTISGFISFPIFTRVFTVAEYGVLNLVSATLGLVLAISKLGIQHSIVRFYGEVRSGERSTTLTQYLSTTLFGMLAVSLFVTTSWVVTTLAIPSSWWDDPRTTDLFLITAALLVVRTLDSALSNFLRAEERSGILNAYNVVKRYGTLVVILIALFYVARNLYGFFWATVVGEFVVVALLFLYMRRTRTFEVSAFSPDLFRKMLYFGIPMIAFELSGIVLNIGDRYVIEKMLGSEALGIYSAGYNFCQYVQAVFLAALSQAAVPMYVRTWAEKGPEETARFIRMTLHYFLMVAMPIVAGVSAVGQGMLIILASEKYADGSSIIPYVAGGMAIDATLAIVGAGLYIHKRTLYMAGMMAACAVLNIVLNILLIPGMGIVGAAMATLVSYTLLAVGAWFGGRKLLAVSFPWGSTFKFAAMAAVMYLTVASISLADKWTTLAVQITAGVLVYSTLVLCFDRSSRDAVRLVAAKLSKGSR